jgi:hypothetical protein
LLRAVHRIRGPKDDTGTSSGQASTFTSVWLPQDPRVTQRPRMPFWRILPIVIGSIGLSKRGMSGFYRRLRRTGTGLHLPGEDRVVRLVEKVGPAPQQFLGLMRADMPTMATK